MRKRLMLFIAFMLVFSAAGPAFGAKKQAKEAAKQPAKEAVVELPSEPVVKTRIVSGTVSAVSKDFIAVVYSQKKGSEEEIAFSVPMDVKLEHITNLQQLMAGDTIDIQYDEVTEFDKAGPKSKRLPRVISFVRPAPVAPASSVVDTGAAQEQQ